MTGAQLQKDLDFLEASATSLAVEVVRTIAAIRVRLAMVEEALEVSTDELEGRTA